MELLNAAQQAGFDSFQVDGKTPCGDRGEGSCTAWAWGSGRSLQKMSSDEERASLKSRLAILDMRKAMAEREQTLRTVENLEDEIGVRDVPAPLANRELVAALQAALPATALRPVCLRWVGQAQAETAPQQDRPSMPEVSQQELAKKTLGLRP